MKEELVSDSSRGTRLSVKLEVGDGAPKLGHRLRGQRRLHAHVVLLHRRRVRP